VSLLLLLQAALDVLQEQQALRETAVCEGTDRGLPQDEVTRRLEVFDQMVAAAETRGKGLKLEMRLRLAQPSLRQQQQQVAQQQQQQQLEQQQQQIVLQQEESSSAPAAAAAAAAAEVQETPAAAGAQPAAAAAH
jgi:mannose-1-phosphate guanylyltransferase